MPRGHKTEISIPEAVLGLTVILTAFRGLLSNYFPPIIWIADGVFIIVLVEIIIESGKNARPPLDLSGARIIVHHYAWSYLCLYIMVFQLLIGRTYIMRDAVFSYRNDVLYTTPFILIILLNDSELSLRLYRLFIRCGTAICIFAVIQFVFRGVLPNSLLTLQVDKVTGFWGRDVVRVNGLIGNSIIFSGFVVLFISLIWAEILYKSHNSIELIIELVIAIISNLLTFSRASIVGMVGILLFEYLFSTPRNDAFKALKRTVVIILALIIGVYVALTHFSDTIIVQRLLNTNKLWNAGSDQVHASTIDYAIEVIRKHLILGYGAGKVGYASSLGSGGVIRDGAFWIYLLQWGLPACIVFGSLVARTLITAFKCKEAQMNVTKAIGLGYLSANIYLIIASFINSAYSARSVLVFLWIIAGILYVLYAEDKALMAEE